MSDDIEDDDKCGEDILLAEAAGVATGTGAIVVDENKKVHTVSRHTDYLSRGEGLKDLNLLEYCLLIGKEKSLLKLL